MHAPCHKTRNTAFINPDGATPQAVRAAQEICAHCPLLKQCAVDALTSGTSIKEDHRAPANDVIQAGVVCRGDMETAWKLAAIAGVPVPTWLIEAERRDNLGARRPDHCRNCHKPMVKWNRYEEQPAGYVMHRGRGFCTQCRKAYNEDLKRNPGKRGVMRKHIDRKRHSAPSVRKGVVTVQPALFELGAQ